jgi:hypothetical protein
VARNINMNIGDVTATGSNVSVSQYTVTISASWIKDDGTPGSDSRTVLFPNVLAQLTAAQQKQLLAELLIKTVRILAGIGGKQ